MQPKKTATHSTIQETAHPAFRFVVTVGNDTQGVFTECTLPVIEWEIEEVKEGGLNEFPHQLPGRRKGARLTLKHGVGKNTLLDWYLGNLNPGTDNFKRKSITVKLLDFAKKKEVTILTWHISDAYPIKWTGPQLKTGDNSIAIQSLEMACGEVTVTYS